MPYGFTPRFAIKANPHPEIIRIFSEAGMHFDASSDYEVYNLIEMGVEPTKISLASQQPARKYAELHKKGVKLVATSLRQLDMILAAGVKDISVRINPDIGHGGTNRTTTGGINASFGIWHEYIPEILKKVSAAEAKVKRLHIHVGSGFDASVWGGVMDTALLIANILPDVVSLDIGGGYKVARVEEEHEADLVSIAAIFSEKLNSYFETTGRQLHLEIEPGTWMVANAGYLVCEAIDIVDTGEAGHKFIKLNTGMNDILRPSMYGSQHPIYVVNDSKETAEYVVVGHNCESGDILSPLPGDSEGILARELPITNVGDKVVIGGAGAYCASMRARGYNAFPDAVEALV